MIGRVKSVKSLGMRLALTEAEASGKRKWRIFAVPTPAAYPSGPWWAAGVFRRGPSRGLLGRLAQLRLKDPDNRAGYLQDRLIA
jgi:hypothetical protein